MHTPSLYIAKLCGLILSLSTSPLCIASLWLTLSFFYITPRVVVALSTQLHFVLAVVPTLATHS